MTTSEPKSKLIQWRWFWISLALYLGLYLLPVILLTSELIGSSAIRITRIVAVSWVFGGPIIIGTVAAYRSRGVALLEPPLASFVLVTLVILAEVIFHGVRWSYLMVMRDIVGPIVVTFLLSVIGAWMGVQIWKASKNKKAEGE